MGSEFWSVTGWKEARAVAGDDAAFVSGYGMFLGFGPDNPDPASQRMMVVTDGPHRRALRGAMQSFFSAARIRRHAERLTEIFRASLEPRVGDPGLDFAREIAWKVPMAAVCELLALPEDDHQMLGEMTNAVLSTQDPQIEPAVAATLASTARADIATYFRELAERRHRTPGDDLVSALLGDIGDGPLPVADVMLNLLSVLVAANETTRLALTGAMVAFAQYPDQWDRLRKETSRYRSAVEEILRWTSPALHISRTAAKDIELGGTHIRAGDVVALWLPAGNRDPAVFPDPYTFDVARNGEPHLTFGHGPHYCIGAALARVEITALLTVLAPLVGRVGISGPLRHTHSHYLTGYVRAPLLLEKA